MSQNRLKFIDANAPLPELAANYFIESHKDKILGHTANFAGTLCLLPTRGACRNLKESIVNKLLSSGVKNILKLKISTYEDFLLDFCDKSQINKLQNFSIWLSIILGCDFNAINALIPDGENISRKEVLHIAKEIIFLQQKLNEDLISIQQACQTFKNLPDSKRWQDLALLEDIYNYKIKDLGKSSALESKLSAIEKASQSNVEKILIIGNPDITNSLKFFIEKAEDFGKKIEIALFAKEEDKELFDDFAAPLYPKYSKREIAIKEEDIYPCATCQDEAILVQNLAKSYGDIATKTLAIACEQKESASIFQDALKEINLNAVALENNKLSKSALFDLLKNIKSFLEEKDFSSFRNLCLNSYLIDYIESKGEKLEDVLNKLDRIKEESACKELPTLKILLKNDSLKNLINFFEEIDLDNVEEKILNLCKTPKIEIEIEALELFKDSLSSIFEVNKNSTLKFNLDEVFTILFENLEATSAKTSIEKDSIILQDWMEIFWSKSAHIVLCDMNDGIVPLRENNGLFLNDSIRSALSMRTQGIRQARDAYMLETLANSRASDTYKISIILSQRNTAGELLIASRILFQTKRENIAKRVNFLFKEIAQEISNDSKEVEWKLNVESKAFEGNYSVSKFNTYINSPWLFYLQNVLKMNITQQDKEELSFADFGNIYHLILEKFGKSEFKNSENPEEINNFFLKTLDDILYKTFANKPRIQIKIQLEDLKSRLYYTAQEQVKHKKEGWEILYVEEKFKDYKLADGILLNGVFDRVDYHKDFGYLIIDYKTKDKADNNIVEKSHLSIKKDGSVVWQNLQIPIYLEVFENLELKTDKNADLNSAYFCATKDGASTKIYRWHNAKDYVDDAKKLAIEIAEKIKKQDFFNFEKDDKYNSFDTVFKLDFKLLKKNIKLL